MENPHSIFELTRQGVMVPSFFQKKFESDSISTFFLSDSNFYCSHLLRSDFSRWINFWEKDNLLFHRFVPSFLCDLIISRFFRKSNWQINWIFKAFFVQWGELYFKYKIRTLQVNFFVIYYKCWGLVNNKGSYYGKEKKRITGSISHILLFLGVIFSPFYLFWKHREDLSRGIFCRWVFLHFKRYIPDKIYKKNWLLAFLEGLRKINLGSIKATYLHLDSRILL